MNVVLIDYLYANFKDQVNLAEQDILENAEYYQPGSIKKEEMTEYSVVDEDRVNSIKNLHPNLIDFKLDDFTICAVCKYDFSKGEREPGLLLCRHSICIGCMQR